MVRSRRRRPGIPRPRIARARLRRALHGAGLLRGSRELRALSRLSAQLPTHGNDLRVFHDGDRLYAQMLRDIAGASGRISMEMYMLMGDAIGHRFVHALADAARRGVEVRVVYDALGSLGTPRSLFRQLSDAGARVVEYHPVAPWRRRFALFRRDHRKTLVVDGRIGYTGGANIGQQWVGHHLGGESWRDTQVRVEGPAAGDLEVLFQETWFTETGEVLGLARTVPRAPVTPRSEPRGPQVYVVAGGGTPRRRIRRLYRTAFDLARQRIRITSAYFVPDRGIRRAIYRARKRGVEVELLLPRVSDIPVTTWASRAFYHRLLRRGVRIHLWEPTILHAKTVAIDDRWSTVGSGNIDHLSFSLNLEANLAIIDPDTGRQLSERFARDLRFAHLLTLDEWQRRPWQDRLLERLASLFRRLL